MKDLTLEQAVVKFPEMDSEFLSEFYLSEEEVKKEAEGIDVRRAVVEIEAQA